MNIGNTSGLERRVMKEVINLTGVLNSTVSEFCGEGLITPEQLRDMVVKILGATIHNLTK